MCIRDSGIAQGALDVTVEYMKARKQFGMKLSQMEALRFTVAELATQIEAARLLVYKAANMKDKHLAYGPNAAMAKLFAAETAMHVTTTVSYTHLDVYKRQRIKSAEVIAFDDLGAEAVRKLFVEEFPVTVVLDSRGGDLYAEGRAEYLKSVAK